MTRKLHNSVTALFATSGLLLLSLMAANPAPPAADAFAAPIEVQAEQPVREVAAQARHAAAAAKRIEARAEQLQARMDAAKDTNAKIGEVVGFGAEATTLAAIAAAMDEAEAKDVAAVEETTEHKPTRKRSFGRQSVSMPFFSFAPRG